MKIAFIQNTQNSFLDKLSFILSKNKFSKISISYTDATLYAEKRPQWFLKKSKVLIKIIKEDETKGKKIQIMVNENERRYDTAENENEKLEEKILDIIYNYF